jgi:hypothetical protein
MVIMSRSRSISASLLAAALLLAAPAHAFVAPNRLPVQPTGSDPTTFTVSYRGTANGDIDFWCAAGAYANSQLRASSTARIYRISPPPRRAGQGITFSMNPAGAAGSTGLATIGGSSDGSMTVAAARQQCQVSRQLSQTRR